MAGGAGERLWPMSRRARPKQFFSVVSNAPLLADAYRRMLRFLSAEQIWIATTPAYADQVHMALPDLAHDRILFEPAKRDTGPAMTWICASLMDVAPDETVVFVPSDHYIGDEEQFFSCLRVADALIQEQSCMVDIGVRPQFPSTVLGYTKVGETLETRDGVAVRAFLGHTEKPSYEVAKQYLESGQYLWHASYFAWTPRRMWGAVERNAPDIAQGVREARAFEDEVARRGRFEQIAGRSFDYAVMEHLDPSEVKILEGHFGWSDIGAWDLVYERLAEEQGRLGGQADRRLGKNITKGRAVLVDTQDSLVYAPEDKLVAVLGMRDVIVVDTGDALLVCPRSNAQRVKEVLAALKRDGHEDVI